MVVTTKRVNPRKMLRTVFDVNVGVVVIIYLVSKAFLCQKAGSQDYITSKQIRNCLGELVREQKQKLFYLRGITKMPGTRNDLDSCNFNVKALECY